MVGAAVAALTLGAQPARAACTPDPVTAAGTQVVCVGTDADGFETALRDTFVTVDPTAIVRADAGDAAAIIFGERGSLNVAGLVEGGAADGVTVTSNQKLRIFVGPAGAITGNTAITMPAGVAGNIDIDNAGRIEGTGTDRYAITGSVNSTIGTLHNRQRGRILGAVVVQSGFGTVTNDGLMDGGDKPALWGETDAETTIGRDQVLINNGTMTSATSNQVLAATVMMSGTIVNSGRIESTDSGAVIFGEALDITNKAGGVIRGAAGQLANTITADALALTNSGLIEGTVRASGADGSLVYQHTGGEIRGNVIFGAGNDAFLVEARGGTPTATGVTGTIEGGDGIDSFGYRATASGTVTFPDLPTGFERYAVDLCGCDVTVTIGARADGAAYANGLYIGGEGEVLIDANFNTTGQVLQIEEEDKGDVDGDTGLVVTNRGTLTGTLTAVPGLDVNAESFTNEGAINISSAAFNAADADTAATIRTTSAAGFVNSGTIDIQLKAGSPTDVVPYGLQILGNATNSGSVLVKDAHIGVLFQGGTLNNTGTIRSIQGDIAHDVPPVTLDIQASARLNNSGTIEAVPGSTALAVSGNSRATNLAQGQIKGSVAVAGGGALSNWGLIDGSINSRGSGAFVHLAQGSSVSGNVTLGAGGGSFGDTLVIDASRIDQTGRTGAIDTSGIVGGTVDMGGGANDKLWLQATASRSMNVLRGNAAITGVANVGAVVYEAAGEGTVLTLMGPLDDAGTSSQTITRTVRVAGDGTVVLNNSVGVDTLVDGAGLPLAGLFVEEGSTASRIDGKGTRELDVVVTAGIAGTGGYVDGDGNAKDRAVVDVSNARSLTLQGSARIEGVRGVVLEAGDASVLIEGNSDIRTSDSARSSLVTLVRGGGEITNRSVINENGGLADGENAIGVDLQGGGTLRNERTPSGTTPAYHGQITTNGNAVVMSDFTTLVNSGTIISAVNETDTVFGDAAAVRVTGTHAVIVNEGRGVIQQGGSRRPDAQRGAAIESTTGNVYLTNAASIKGSVLLGTGNDLTVSALGGTVTGNVDLGGGNDSFLMRGRTDTGITGTLAGGDGIDAYGFSYTSGADNVFELTKQADFEMFGVEAAGADTRVALTSAAGVNAGVRIFGDGIVENRANISTTGSALELGYAPGTPTVGLRVINAAGTVINAETGLDGRVENYLSSFENAGTINATAAAVFVSYPLVIDSFRFVNAGTGVLSGGDYGAFVGVDGDISASNAGVIRSTNDNSAAAFFRADAGTSDVSNSGRLEAAGLFSNALTAQGENVLLANSGEILATGVGGVGVLIRADGEGLYEVNPEDCLVSDTPTPQVVARFDNSGTVRVSGGGQVNDTGATTASIAVAFDVRGDGAIAELNNAAGGVIEATGTNAIAVGVQGGGGTNLDLHRFRLVNAGTISGTGATATTGFAGDPINLFQLNLEHGQYTAAGAIQTLGTVDDVTNTGTIIGNVDLGEGNDIFRGGGTITGDVRLGSGDDTFVILADLVLNGTVYGGDGYDTLTVELSGTTGLDSAKFREFESRAARVGDGREATINGDATGFDTILVDGGTLNVSAGPVLTTATATTITGGDTTNDTVNVLAGGGVAGSIVLNGGDDVVTNAGTIQGDVLLGAGNDRYVSLGGTVAGAIDGGAGTDTFEFLLTADASAAPTGLASFESLAARGAHRLTLTAAQAYDTLELLDGADLTLNAGTGSVTNILGDDSDNDVVLNTAVAGRIALGGGNDALTLTLGGSLGDIDGGAGTDVLNATLTQAVTIGNLAGFETANFAGASPVTFTGTIAADQTVNFDGSDNSLTLASGAELFGNVNGGAGRDVLTLETVDPNARTLVAAQIQNFEDLVANGTGTVALTGQSYGFQTVAVNGGHLTLGAGTALTAGQVTFDGANNVLSLASGATLTGPVDGGAGTDTLALAQGTGTTRSLASLNYTGFEVLAASGAGTLDIDRNAAFDAVTLSGGTTTVVAGAALTAPVTGSDAAETFAVLGTVAGNVDLGAGNDRLVLGSTNAVTGGAAGGAGSDTLAFASAGTYAAPTVWDGTGYTGFETLENTAGTTSLTGNASFETVNVAGGRLIGQAGTTLTATGGVLVAQGATFGSAGIVNGNIDVRGTLSPGASPGTMTVNGNVGFAAGSNLLLELTPTAQDLLNISGTMTIAQGATVDITGVLDNLPGRVLDLVVAQGGITGSFTTINKSASVFGFVAQNGNRLQLRGEFQNSAAYVKNVQASIDYANAVLREGQMVQAFTGALPRLIDAAGTSNARAFGQLTAEAYASASQIGRQNGLAVTDAVRALSLTTPAEAGFFAFGQGLANWGDLAPQNRVTVGKGDVDSTGVLGGMGYGFADGGRVGAFLGYLDAEQKLGSLEASTKADGLVGGVFADASLAGFGLHALLAYAQADAETNRTLDAAQASARGTYDLGTWIADASLDYRTEVAGATVMPKLGLTYLRTQRDGLTETGGGAFGLAVAGRSTELLYGDAGVTVSTKTSLGGMGFAPYGEFGLRHRLDGDQVVATARFAGAPGLAGLTVAGVDEGKTVARVGTGFGLEVAPNIRLNAAYTYEMGNNDRHSLTGGLSVRF